MASKEKNPESKSSAAVISRARDVIDSRPDDDDQRKPPNLLAYFQLLVFASPTWIDILLLATGLLAAVAAGVPFPLMGIIFGQLVDDMNDTTCSDDLDSDLLKAFKLVLDKILADYRRQMDAKVLQLVYLSIATLVLIYIYVTALSLFSQRLAQRVREGYFESLLRHPPAFFDVRPAGELASRLDADVGAVQAGTSEKLGMVVASLSFFVTAYVVAFLKNVRLAAMLVSVAPAFLVMAVVGGFFVQKFSGRVSDGLAAASAVASEAINHVAVVRTFGAAGKLEANFSGAMDRARSAGMRKAVAAAAQAGMLYFIAFSANALAFWQGSKMIAATVAGTGDGTTIGEIYTVVFIIIDACVILGQVAPFLPLFSAAAAAFDKLREDMDFPPGLNHGSDETESLEFAGEISFRDVSFAYPSRPDKLVLNKVSFSLPAGKHMAVVGPSGSGKSTISSLISRLYDTLEGDILLDGREVKTLNIHNVRSLVGVVQQEPTLFNRSILENIALGLVGSPDPDHQDLKSTIESPSLAQLVEKLRAGEISIAAILENGGGGQEEPMTRILRLIYEAAELAEARGFIDGLQHGFGTEVGVGGNLLSGGQKQRIALARALVRKPRILVLDEATSALDSVTEWRIHENLKGVSQGRTVISIAHRLSTVKDADNIVVMKNGQVVEQGTHPELMARTGSTYSDLVKLQEDNNKADERSTTGASIETTSSMVSVLDHKVDAVPHLQGSKSKTSLVQEDDILDRNRGTRSVVKRLGQYSRPQLGLVILGFASAFIVGGTYSGSGLIFGNTVGKVTACNSPSSILSLGRLLSGMFFMLACVEFLANFSSWGAFGFVAERLLYRLRVLSFRSLFSQSMDFFDSGSRDSATLLSVITKDTAELGSFSGSVMGTLVSVSVNLVTAIILSHIVAWKIAIVCLVCVPILLGAGLMQLRQIARFHERHTQAFARSIGITIEAVNSIKTVAALSLEKDIFCAYRRSLRKPRRDMAALCAYANIWLAIGYSTGNLIYAFAYWWGGRLILKGEYSPTQFFIVLVAMLVGAQLWGQMFGLAPEISRAKSAASRVLNLIDIDSSEDGTSEASPVLREESDPEKKGGAGNLAPKFQASTDGMAISFRDVSFSYPSRPDVEVLKEISLELRPGTFCGLVGPSGAGKTTIMALLQGLYTPTSGTVRLDGLDATRPDCSSSSLRDAIAVVPQDSALFSGTVRFNVDLGARSDQTTTSSTTADVEAACRAANVHDDVSALPQGYETECGPNGTRLSGGQRQRLAIARALVRRPRLLLLDESTSALDAAGERLVREGLERAARGATVVTITHRLHTVRRADVIFVVEGGRIVDRGTHEELVERSESYRANVLQQQV